MAVAVCGLPKNIAALGTVAGAALACVWALSPLAVCAAIALVFIFAAALRGLTPREWRWVAGLLGVALVLRLLVLLAFSVSVDYKDNQFPILVGDESLYMMVSLWLRNISVGIPISAASFDNAYSWRDTADGFFYGLAYLQILFGPSPYGFHFLNIACFFGAAVLLYRAARTSYGRVPALGGLAVLLFLPTMFVWSISGLKEPLHNLMLSVLVVAALQVVRARRWAPRVAAAAATVLASMILGSLRVGALAGAIACVFAAYAAVIVMTKRWAFVLALILSCGAAVAVVQSSSVPARALSLVQGAAEKHIGHVRTVGYGYKLLDQRFYMSDPPTVVRTMTMVEAARFVVRALVSFVVVPAPWQAVSRPALAYLPQQIIYYVLFALAAVGCVEAFRKDALLTALLAANVGFYVAGVALLNGNIGTLVRHRDLIVPLVVWFGALGACKVLDWAVPHARRTRVDSLPRLDTEPAETSG